jgi:hypothetical protein
VQTGEGVTVLTVALIFLYRLELIGFFEAMDFFIGHFKQANFSLLLHIGRTYQLCRDATERIG